MRLFVAVEFDSDVRDAIARGIERFPVDNPPWRWTGAENWHITLKFIGDASDRDAIAAALEPVGHAHAGFDMALGPFGGFPGLRRPRVLFYDVTEGRAALAALAADVDAALARALGLARDSRPFRAHATIARVKRSLPGDVTAQMAATPPLENARQRVEAFVLLRSHLDPAGARYEPLLRFTLSRAK